MLQGDYWENNSPRKPQSPLSVSEVGYFGKLLKKSKKTFGGSDLFYLAVIDGVVKGNNVIKDEVKRNKLSDVSKFNLIVDIVCETMMLLPDQIRIRRRFENIVTARKLIIFFTRFSTKIPLKRLGKLLTEDGKYDHATLINATKVAYTHIKAKDEVFTTYFTTIQRRLRELYAIDIDLNDSNPPQWFKDLRKRNEK